MKFLLSSNRAEKRKAVELVCHFLQDSYFSDFIIDPSSNLSLTNLSLNRVGGISPERFSVKSIEPFLLPILKETKKSPDYLLELDFRFDMPKERLTRLSSVVGDREDKIGVKVLFDRRATEKKAEDGYLFVMVDELVTRGKWDNSYGNYAAVKRAFTPLQAELEKNVRRILRK